MRGVLLMGQLVVFGVAVVAAYVVGSLLGREARRHDLEAVDAWRSGEIASAALFTRLGAD